MTSQNDDGWINLQAVHIVVPYFLRGAPSVSGGQLSPSAGAQRASAFLAEHCSGQKPEEGRSLGEGPITKLWGNQERSPTYA
jgi:hypothetical protein